MIKFLLLLIFLTMGDVTVVSASEVASRIAPSDHIVLPTSTSDNNVAAQFTALTSLAISPILVGGGRSAITYLRATEAERKLLPWTSSPWYWGSLLAIGISFFFAHLIGTSTPVLGKFVEAARSFEGKASLIYASPLFLTSGADLLGSLDRAGLTISPIGAAVAANSIVSASPTSTVGGGLFGLAVFGVIWLTNQAVHTIVLLSPSMLLGSAVRILHLVTLGALLAASAISPTLGAILALILVCACAKLSGWSFRLSVFGTVFAWDLLTFRRKQGFDKDVLAFSSLSLPLPPRTLGHLMSKKGELAFVYRPWLIGPSRVQVLTGLDRILNYGIFYSVLLNVQKGEKTPILVLPPRYRGSQTALATFMECQARPSVLRGGIGGAWAWLKTLLHGD